MDTNANTARDPVYGVVFPSQLAESQAPPEPESLGEVILTGRLATLGNIPFVQVALKTENAHYYILPEILSRQYLSGSSQHGHTHTANGSVQSNALEGQQGAHRHTHTQSDHAHSHSQDLGVNTTAELEIRAELFVAPLYFANRRLAYIEYHLENIQDIVELEN